MCCKRLAPMRFVPLSYFCTCWNVRAVGELLLAHSEHLSGHSDTAAHVFIDGVGSFFDHCLFTIHVYLRRGLRRKGCDQRGRRS
jgi:hypothetical protein